MDKRVLFSHALVVMMVAAGCGGSGSSPSTSPDIGVAPSKYLYVANSGDATVSAFAISSAGDLTPVAGGNVATSLQAPTGLAVSAAGKVYLGSSVSRNVTTFSADFKSGKLSSPTSLPSIFLNAPSGSNAANLVACGTHLFAVGEAPVLLRGEVRNQLAGAPRYST